MRRIHESLVQAVAALLVAGGVVMASPAGAEAPPVLTLPGAQTVNEGNDLTFNVSATDPDGQTVYFQAANLPLSATFTDHLNSTATFDWPTAAGDAGSYVVSFLGDDGFGGTATGTVSITVVHVNAAPVLYAIPDRSIEQGTTQFVSLTGYDPDGDPVTYSSSPLPSWATLLDFGGGSGDVTLAPTLATPTGATTITVTLSDGQARTSQSFTVTVTASQTANHPPVLASIGAQSVAEGQTRQVAISATDVDGNTLVWQVTLPSFVTLTPGTSSPGSLTGTLVMAPGYCAAGSYSANVSVWDGTALAQENFTITVTNTNRPPAWNAASYSASLAEGAVTTVGVSASDPDESCTPGAPHLSVLSSDAGSALQASLADAGDGTGSLTLTAAAVSAGTWHVTLRATDWGYPNVTSDVVVTVSVIRVAPLIVARAWSESDPLRLNIGKPRERFYFEPVNGFALGDVDTTSFTLKAWDGSGTVSSIAPIAGSVDGTHDRDGNGQLELRMDFSKDDLRALFANLSTTIAADMTLQATLHDGTVVAAQVATSVVPERGVIKKVGPNPLNPEAVVTVKTSVDGKLRVRVFDANGRFVRLLDDETSVPAGIHLVRFDGKDDRGRTLASGRYFVQAETAEQTDVTAVTILK